ncbi:ComEC/Rec2 family competence protein [uncultured Tenacibaculum sp.]|uniref:ComEC/Rec2 family competence protein n=1 Tax=uncultured Tenacibaculum sp. TaxID=174713 RepID=UPI00262E0BB6|nr:ComEC/Rec2 family competence protein [uncultured Tenacibaculum sp.]
MRTLVSYTPTYFLVFLIIGIIIQFQWNIWCYTSIYVYTLLFILLLILFYLKQRNTRVFFTILSSLLFVLIGVCLVFIQDTKNHKYYYKNYYEKNNFAVLTVQQVLKPNLYNHKYIAKVAQVNQQNTCGFVLVSIQKDSLLPLIREGQQLYLKPDFKELTSPLNPYQFNYKNYLAKQYIYQQIFTKYSDFKVLKPTVISINSISAKFRANIQLALKKHHFSSDVYAVINALLLGQRQSISKELQESYVNAGAIHILAISGLHIGIILWILSFFLKPLERLKYGKIFKTGLIICFLWCFAFIAGLSASVVRAVTMFSFVSIALISNRKQHIEHSLITSMIFLLFMKPLFLFDVGFQLSYVAVFGIVWVQPLLSSIWKPKFILTRKLWQLFTVSMAAQLGILPISLYYFNQFSSLFIISNIIIIPFLGSILAGGILIILLALINLLPQEVANIYEYIISLMNSIIYEIANQEVFLLKNIYLSFPKMLLWYGCIILTCQLIIHKRNKHLLYALCSIIALQLLSLIETRIKNTKEELIVFHKNKTSVIGVRKGKEMSFYNNSKSSKFTQEMLNLYKTHQNISISHLKKHSNILTFKDNVILIVDSLGVYNLSLKRPLVLLQHSPKINLRRLITYLQPRCIVVDGSNYNSYVLRWKETCEQQKTPFYYTGKNGAYILK